MKSIPLVRSTSLRIAAPVVAGVVVLGGAAAAIASSSGGGPALPPAKPLSAAISDTLAAKQPDGLTASFSLRNRLIQGGPLEAATGKLQMTGDGQLRADVTAGDHHWQLGVADRRVTAYDVEGKTAYSGTIPAEIDGALRMLRSFKPTPAMVDMALEGATSLLDVSGAKPTTVAGRPAYQVRVAPAHDGGLLGAAEISWDPTTGLPLRAALYAHGEDAPVLDLAATDVELGPVSADAVRVTPPPGTKVVRIDGLASPAVAGGAGVGAIGAGRTGVAAVGQAVRFDLAAPAELAGLPRKEVREIRIGDQSGAVVTYGEGLGALVVTQIPTALVGDGLPWALGRGKGLPEIAVDGATGRELATALGTLISFERDGVSYTLAGSIPAVAAETAARDLNGR